FGRVLPGVGLLGVLVAILRWSPAVRVVLYIALFVLFRDAMTPLGLWRFGAIDGVFWIRLSEDAWFLVAFGLASAGLVAAAIVFDRETRRFVRFRRGSLPRGIAVGVGAAILVVVPLAIAYRFVPIDLRGGDVLTQLLPALLVFALLGNLFEELLFRGYVVGALEPRYGAIRAGVLSGFVFAGCHVFLALTVTDVGVPLLLFTVWEGVIAGLVGGRYGVVPATLTHGGAIFLLSSGLI
ncbi:MAG: type II CAAX prenyl endopeptidase Rce1 family protein, partial [Alkalispirochaeta sp.]